MLIVLISNIHIRGVQRVCGFTVSQMRATTSYYPLIFISFAFAASFDPSRQDEVHIVPTEIHSCPMAPCLTLEEFANSLSSYNVNIALFFVGGSHRLENTISLSNTTSLSMVSINNNDHPSISCSEFAKFIFSEIESVYVHGLIFDGCTSNEIQSVTNFTIKHCMFLGQENTSVPENIEMVAVPNFLSIAMESYRNYFNLLQITVKL